MGSDHINGNLRSTDIGKWNKIIFDEVEWGKGFDKKTGNVEKKDAKILIGEHKELSVKQKKAEQKKLQRQEKKDEKARLKKEAKELKAEQKALKKAQSLPGKGKVEKASKNVLPEKAPSVSHQIVSTRTNVNHFMLAGAANALSKDLTKINTAVITAAASSPPKNATDRQTFETISAILDNAGDTYKTLLDTDKEEAAKFKESVLTILDQIGEKYGEKVKADLSECKDRQSLVTYQGRFMRENSLAEKCFGKMKDFSRDKILDSLTPLSKNIAKNKDVRKALVSANSNWDRESSSVEIKGTFGKPSVNAPLDKVIPPKVQTELKAAYTQICDSMLDPDNLDDDTARTLGRRYGEIYSATLEGLKDNTELTQQEKIDQAKSFAHASVVNELGLRLLSPILVQTPSLIPDSLKSSEKTEMSGALMTVSKAMQKQINYISGKPGLSEEQVSQLKSNTLQTDKKLTTIDVLVSENFQNIYEKTDALVQKCVNLASQIDL